MVPALLAKQTAKKKAQKPIIAQPGAAKTKPYVIDADTRAIQDAAGNILPPLIAQPTGKTGKTYVKDADTGALQDAEGNRVIRYLIDLDDGSSLEIEASEQLTDAELQAEVDRLNQTGELAQIIEASNQEAEARSFERFVYDVGKGPYSGRRQIELEQEAKRREQQKVKGMARDLQRQALEGLLRTPPTAGEIVGGQISDFAKEVGRNLKPLDAPLEFVRQPGMALLPEGPVKEAVKQVYSALTPSGVAQSTVQSGADFVRNPGEWVFDNYYAFTDRNAPIEDRIFSAINLAALPLSAGGVVRGAKVAAKSLEVLPTAQKIARASEGRISVGQAVRSLRQLEADAGKPLREMVATPRVEDQSLFAPKSAAPDEVRPKRARVGEQDFAAPKFAPTPEIKPEIDPDQIRAAVQEVEQYRAKYGASAPVTPERVSREAFVQANAAIRQRGLYNAIKNASTGDFSKAMGGAGIKESKAARNRILEELKRDIEFGRINPMVRKELEDVWDNANPTAKVDAPQAKTAPKPSPAPQTAKIPPKTPEPEAPKAPEPEAPQTAPPQPSQKMPKPVDLTGKRINIADSASGPIPSSVKQTVMALRSGSKQLSQLSDSELDELAKIADDRITGVDNGIDKASSANGWSLVQKAVAAEKKRRAISGATPTPEPQVINAAKQGDLQSINLEAKRQITGIVAQKLASNSGDAEFFREYNDLFPQGTSTQNPSPKLKAVIDAATEIAYEKVAGKKWSELVKPKATKPATSPTKSSSKEPWQMTRKEFLGEGLTAYKGLPKVNWKTGEPIEFVDATQAGKQVAGYFSSDKAVAERFARTLARPESTQVTEARIVFKRPYEVDAQDRPAREFMTDALNPEQNNSELMQALESSEYDGLIIRNTSDEGTIYVPKTAQQIRADITHRLSIEQALREGKFVSAEVLADYPDLADKYNKPAPAPNQAEAPKESARDKAKRLLAEKGSNLEGFFAIDGMFSGPNAAPPKINATSPVETPATPAPKVGAAAPDPAVKTAPEPQAAPSTPPAAPQRKTRRASKKSRPPISAANVDTDELAREIGQAVHSAPDKKAVTQAFKDAESIDDATFESIRSEVRKGGRVLNDAETAAYTRRIRQVDNEIESLYDMMGKEGVDRIGLERVLAAKKSELYTLIEETRKAGTEWGRAGVTRAARINADFSYAGQVQRLERALSKTGATPDEIKQYIQGADAQLRSLANTIKRAETAAEKAGIVDEEVKKAFDAAKKKLAAEQGRVARTRKEILESLKRSMQGSVGKNRQRGALLLPSDLKRFSRDIKDLFRSYITPDADLASIIKMTKEDFYQITGKHIDSEDISRAVGPDLKRYIPDDTTDLQYQAELARIEYEQIERRLINELEFKRLSLGGKIASVFSQGTRRAILGSDLSPLLVQGMKVLASGFFREYLSGAVKGFKAIKSRDALLRSMASVRQNPYYARAMTSRLAIDPLDVGNDEFMVLGGILKKLSGGRFGKEPMDAWSSRFYAATVTNWRMSMFETLMKQAEKRTGGPVSRAESDFIADFVNQTTGRSAGKGKLAIAGRVLSDVNIKTKGALFTAPSYAISNMQALTASALRQGIKSNTGSVLGATYEYIKDLMARRPTSSFKEYLAKTKPEGEKVARPILAAIARRQLQMYGSFIGLGAILNKFGFEFEADPNERFFGHFRVPTRQGAVWIDITSGLVAPLKLTHEALGKAPGYEQLLAKLGVDPSSKQSGTQAVARYLANRTAPATSTVAAVTQAGESGKYFGESRDIGTKEGATNWAFSFLPLWVQQSNDIYKTQLDPDPTIDRFIKIVLIGASPFGLNIKVDEKERVRG